MNCGQLSEFGPEIRTAGGCSGRAPHRRFWRGCAARSAGVDARRGVVAGGAPRNFPELIGPRRHLRCVRGNTDHLPSFFTERTLADYLAVSDRTVRNWIKRGDLPRPYGPPT